jgi:hypothetical protein
VRAKLFHEERQINRKAGRQTDIMKPTGMLHKFLQTVIPKTGGNTNNKNIPNFQTIKLIN